MIMNDCIFCKIIKGEISCEKIYEDKDTLAFLDIHPYSKGHILIIPKKHCDWIWDMKQKEYIKLNDKVYLLANILRKAFETDWVEEVIAGVGVQHAHIHLLPRKRDDGLGEIPIKPLDSKPSEVETKEFVKKIKSLLKA